MFYKIFRKEDTGKIAENKVVNILKKEGNLILERNFRTRYGEIDIIYIEKKTNTLVFAEVKYRKNSFFGDPYEFVDQGKLDRIQFCAECYLAGKNPENYSAIRIDVFSLLGENFEMEHIKNVTF